MNENPASLGQTLCILAERFDIMGKFGGLSYDIRNPARVLLLTGLILTDFQANVYPWH